jgi:hypothetical protein
VFAVIYHYWKDNRDATPCYQDLANPVVVSIATLRFHHPTVPVYVIDISDRPGDWGPFPNILRFKVIRQAPSLPLYYKGTHDHRDQSLNISYNTFKYCSSTFDVTGLADTITQDTILFSDSDIFYLKHLNPLPKDRFCCRSGFVGYYYYNKTVLKVRKFIELWKACIIKGITDLAYRSVLTTGYRVPGFMNQETAYIHLCKTVEVKDTILDLSPYEHCFEIDYPPDGFWQPYYFLIATQIDLVCSYLDRLTRCP